MWIPFRELRGIKTLKNYESKGVEIKVLKQSIFPTGKIWLPTRQNYLELFDKYLTTTGITSQADTAIDVGCGSGVLSFILAKKMKKSSKIVGIDINENAVLTANINASRL
jgi:ribosomal protein L11 methylase PrmA